MHAAGHGYSGDIRESILSNGSTLAWNARDVGSSLALGTIFPIFSTPMTISFIPFRILILTGRFDTGFHRVPH